MTGVPEKGIVAAAETAELLDGGADVLLRGQGVFRPCARSNASSGGLLELAGLGVFLRLGDQLSTSTVSSFAQARHLALIEQLKTASFISWPVRSPSAWRAAEFPEQKGDFISMVLQRAGAY